MTLKFMDCQECGRAVLTDMGEPIKNCKEHMEIKVKIPRKHARKAKRLMRQT